MHIHHANCTLDLLGMHDPPGPAVSCLQHVLPVLLPDALINVRIAVGYVDQLNPIPTPINLILADLL